CSVVVKCPASNAPENDADNVTNTIKMARISTMIRIYMGYMLICKLSGSYILSRGISAGGILALRHHHSSLAAPCPLPFRTRLCPAILSHSASSAMVANSPDSNIRFQRKACASALTNVLSILGWQWGQGSISSDPFKG
ncbi:hypothetical protein, partial [Yoonia sediminilitoris]